MQNGFDFYIKKRVIGVTHTHCDLTMQTRRRVTNYGDNSQRYTLKR